jgi:hypothetical protein
MGLPVDAPSWKETVQGPLGMVQWELLVVSMGTTRQSLVKDIFGPNRQQHQPLYVNNRTPIQ